MLTYTSNWILLGSYGDLDTSVEPNEAGKSLIGETFQFGNMSASDVTYSTQGTGFDVNYWNGSSPEHVTTLSYAGETTRLDSHFDVKGTITLQDGTVLTDQTVEMMQAENGDLFISSLPNLGGIIESVEVTSWVRAYIGFDGKRWVQKCLIGIIEGDDDDDDFLIGAANTALGGGGDDEFRIDTSQGGNEDVIVIGGETLEEQVQDATNNPGGRIGDVLDLTELDDVTITYDQNDPTWNGSTSESGTASYTNDAGQKVTIHFSEIEIVQAKDGIVEGTSGDDLIDADYTGDPDGDMVDDNANFVIAGEGNDTIYSGGGADKVYGGGGNDTIYSGDGDDHIEGGADDDIIYQGGGNDTVYGGAGSDRFEAPEGGDKISGGEDRDNSDVDVIDGSSKSASVDVVYSGDEQGRYIGGGTFEEIEGHTLTQYGDTADATADSSGVILDGQGGDDILLGGSGDDSIEGGSGSDVIKGGAGNDLLSGGAGNDSLSGGDGDDVFVPGGGRNTINDFGTGNSGPINDGDNTNNDFVDLSHLYNQATYEKAVEDGLIDPNVIKTPLQWLQADQEDDGVLNSAHLGGNTLIIRNGGASVTADKLNMETTGVICFTKGTMITTITGECPVEQLKVGDLVLTADAGFQPLRWIGNRRLSRAQLVESPNFRPIRVRREAFGMGLPTRDLILSPQHRVLISTPAVKRMFGTPEVLVAVKHMTEIEGIDVIEDAPGVEYWHFLMDRHQIVFSNGARTETLYTGTEALKAVGANGRLEILDLFPDLKTEQAASASGAFAPARPIAKGARSRRLAQRIAQNDQFVDKIS